MTVLKPEDEAAYRLHRARLGGPPALVELDITRHRAGARPLLVSVRNGVVAGSCQFVPASSKTYLADGTTAVHIAGLYLEEQLEPSRETVLLKIVDQAAVRGARRVTMLIRADDSAGLDAARGCGFGLWRRLDSGGLKHWVMVKVTGPTVQDPFGAEQLSAAGFRGFVPIRAFKANRSPLPEQSGVYVVVRTGSGEPVFLPTGTGGWFKTKDPNVDVGVLRLKWVPTTQVLYVGKTDTSLRDRVGAYLDFGDRKPVGHWGGRLLWQLADADDCRMAWRCAANAKAQEKELLRAFENSHGPLPYANMPPGLPVC